MKMWIRGAAFAAGIALAFGASVMVACNENEMEPAVTVLEMAPSDVGVLGTMSALDGTQANSVGTMGATDATQLQSFVPMGVAATQAGSSCLKGADTYMQAPTPMQPAAPLIIFRSKRASRQKKAQSKRTASPKTASNRPSKKLKKRHFAGWGIAAVIVSVGALVALRARRRAYSSTMDSTTMDPWNNFDKLDPNNVTVQVYDKFGKKITESIKLPFESQHTYLQENSYDSWRHNEQLLLLKKTLNKDVMKDIQARYKMDNSFSLVRQVMLQKILGLDGYRDASDAFSRLTEGCPKYDLRAPVRVFPIMAKVKALYEINPNDTDGIARVLVAYFTYGKYTVETADNSPGFLDVVDGINGRLDKVVALEKQFPPTLKDKMNTQTKPAS
eukprot:GHVT01041811.1.p1 GENE.GHVT01041811.1~~GHVT01041811.1.p1  ORF type:complete len:387 (+),score=32.47 GHVT01041811.1:533-1693(+)